MPLSAKETALTKCGIAKNYSKYGNELLDNAQYEIVYGLCNGIYYLSGEFGITMGAVEWLLLLVV